MELTPTPTQHCPLNLSQLPWEPLAPTGPSKYDVIYVVVQRLHPLHSDLGVADVLGDEFGPVADGKDRVFQ
jgi:hypothetical protein